MVSTSCDSFLHPLTAKQAAKISSENAKRKLDFNATLFLITQNNTNLITRGTLSPDLMLFDKVTSRHMAVLMQK